MASKKITAKRGGLIYGFGGLVMLMALMALAGCKPELPETSPITSPVSDAASNRAIPSPSETLKTIDQSLSNASKITSPKNVVFDIVPLDYRLPASVSDVCIEYDVTNPNPLAEDALICPIIKIQLAKSNPAFIGGVVNRYISHDDNPELIKFRQKLDDFAQLAIDENSVVPYERVVSILRMTDHNNLVQIAINEQTHTGENRSVKAMVYKLFDLTLQSEVSIDDLLLPEADVLDKLSLAYDQFLQQKDHGPKQRNEHIKNYPLRHPLLANATAYFNHQGLVFVYPHDELGPDEWGQVELVIAFDELEGVLKPAYLFKEQDS